MITNDKLFKKDLIKHKIYTAWQFIEFTRKNIATAQFCKDTLANIINNMTKDSILWEQNAFFDLVEDGDIEGKKGKEITITAKNIPTYDVIIAGKKIDPWFLFDKLLRDFFQYSMNIFDTISQVANAGLLANKEKKIDSVDFQRMEKCFSQATYSKAFPKTAQWFNQVAASDEFKYIEAINNRTKHTADIENKLAMGILGSSNITKIGPFFRKKEQHDEKDLTEQMNETLNFLQKSFEDFLNAFCNEYVQDKYIDDRSHSIGGVYQQKFMNKPEQNLSYAFISVETNISVMPNDIHIVNKRR